MASNTPKDKGQKLKSALRDNLKKRKVQARRLKGGEGAIEMKLRSKAIASDES